MYLVPIKLLVPYSSSNVLRCEAVSLPLEMLASSSTFATSVHTLGTGIGKQYNEVGLVKPHPETA